MKKLFAFAIATAMIIAAFASTSVFAANDPIVFDFTKEASVKAIAADADGTENDFILTLADGVAFLGKNTDTRIEYAYDAADKAAVFTAHDKGGTIDPYFVSAKDDKGGDLPEAYHINTGVYKYLKVAYKTSAAAPKGATIAFLSDVQPAWDLNSGAVLYDLNSDGAWHYDVKDLSTEANWAGTINQIRFNVFSGGTPETPNVAADSKISIAYVGFFATEEEANAFEIKTDVPAEDEPTPSEPTDPSDEPTTPADPTPDNSGNNNNVPNTNTGDVAVIAAVAAAFVLIAVAVILKKRVKD